ncbi:MAG TPA: tRNA lysidine(34) synthetase TilS [Solirubrobacteraceae bacterium]|nr:tRNA lysidine(34) synthetase TilS [Solirubrobacteraceae bacterium]
MVLERVRATGLVREGEPLVVLLSGGRDSVCLLDCAVALGARVTALHVDYGLRAGAAADERHCAALCERLGVELVVERPERPAGGNLQAWARDVRYAAAARLAATIATGHTATDQAETILYRLAASPGRRALLGMAPREGAIVRPLLGVTRAETAAHCERRGLTWREDPTNDSPLFARNRIRSGLVRELEGVHPAAVENVVRTAALLRDEAEVLDEVVATALAGRDSIPVATLAALPRALARLVVRRLAEDAAGGLCPRAANRLDDVLALESGALDLGDGARAVVERGVLRMAPTPPLPARSR